MAKGKRVIFTFVIRSLEALQEITTRGHYSSQGESVREALAIIRALQEQQEEGFTQLVVRNPRTEIERTIVIPLLTAGKSGERA
jgi:hypothetical protein